MNQNSEMLLNGVKHSLHGIHQATSKVLTILVMAKDQKSTYEHKQMIEKTSSQTLKAACCCVSNGTFSNHFSVSLTFKQNIFLDILLIEDVIALL